MAKDKARKTRAAVFHPEFIADLKHWIHVDRRTASRALDIVDVVLNDPFKGIGKPEPLRFLAPNTWSRRLTQEHRIVYVVKDDRVEFLQARYHYS
jgi:toxin YoeB